MRICSSSTVCCLPDCSARNERCWRACCTPSWTTEGGMGLRYSEEDDEFRARARAWLATHVPRSPRPPRGRAAAEFDRAWQRKLYEHGWAGIAWPKEYGGRGLSALQQVIWYEELARAHAPHHINTT